MKYRIVIVDDHLLIAKALGSILANFEDFEVMYECASGLQLQQRLDSDADSRPDVVLLDVSMPVMDGFEVASWLKANYPQILVMALSMQDDEQSVVKMVKNGAKGYLLKNVHPQELANAIRALVTKGIYFPDWATSKVFSSLSNDTIQTVPSIQFSDRERELLKYSSSEMSYKEIADKMCCSTRTVEAYRDSLFEKLGLKSRVGLAVYAIKNGFDA